MEDDPLNTYDYSDDEPADSSVDLTLLSVGVIALCIVIAVIGFLIKGMHG